MADDPTPQFLRQELGVRLRGLRLAMDLTVGQVAQELLCSPSKISRMETGRRGASPRDVRDLCDLYRVDDVEVREELMALAGGARRRRASQDLGEGASDKEYAELESSADGVTACVASLMPALFQTGDYARTQLRGSFPTADQQWIEQRARSFELRQRLLTRKNPPRVLALIDESALYRHVGGRAVMYAQLDRLLRAGSLPNVELRIVPFSAGVLEATEFSFMLLEFESNAVPSMVYTEELGGDRHVKRRAEVELYEHAVGQLLGAALDTSDSARLIRQVRDAYPADQ